MPVACGRIELRVLVGGGLVYVLAAVPGFTGNLGELLSIDGTMASDNFLHLVSGIAAILVDLLGGDIPERRVEAGSP